MVDWFSTISTLKGLCFNNFSSLETLVRAPKKLRQLGELILGSMTLSNETVDLLATLENLQFLRIAHCNLPGSSIGFLRSLKNLQFFDIHGMTKPHDLVVIVAGLSKLQYLSIDDCTLSSAERTFLSASLPNCQINFGSSAVDLTI